MKRWSWDNVWYSNHPLAWLLVPASMVYRLAIFFRRFYLRQYKQRLCPVPIIVVGNLTVGGVGKTPLVIALAAYFKAKGLRVGIVSRGYGAGVGHFPCEVSSTDKADKVGDEPLLIAQKTGCPVVISPKRIDAVQYLLDKYQSQMIISDDGLQHYAMGRAVEIVVIDGSRGLGNGLCLPAGPLREPAQRLKEADFIIVNGADLQHQYPGAYRMDLLPAQLIELLSGQKVNWADLEEPVAAVAAIGNPQRFFALLTRLGVRFKPYSFKDHHFFKAEDLCVAEKTIVMTEKDAVKCAPFATHSMYFLPVEAKVDDKFWDALCLHQGIQHYV